MARPVLLQAAMSPPDIAQRYSLFAARLGAALGEQGVATAHGWSFKGRTLEQAESRDILHRSLALSLEYTLLIRSEPQTLGVHIIGWISCSIDYLGVTRRASITTERATHKGQQRIWATVEEPALSPPTLEAGTLRITSSQEDGPLHPSEEMLALLRALGLQPAGGAQMLQRAVEPLLSALSAALVKALS